MDKYEYQEKLKMIRKLAAEEKYQEAAEIIDQINWRRVRTARTLYEVGKILGKVERYEKAKELLQQANYSAPTGRDIIYELAEISIREGNLADAEDYYGEFIEVAPRDSKRYILRYYIDRARGASADALISVLESLKERDFDDKWSYELAHLYYKAGQVEKCVELCDEIILWFGDGEYVERALELKMLYEPLTGRQKKLYEEMKMKKDGFVRVAPDDVRTSGEILHNEVTIPTIQTDLNRYNTVNLQQEIAKSMQQIMEATERDTVTEAMNTIRRKVAESQIPMLEEAVVPATGLEHIETDQEIDQSLNLNFQMILQEENDGQMTMFPLNDSVDDRQITGQLSIDDIYAGWAKTSRAAELVLEDAKYRRLESAKARALAETGNLMDKIAEVEAIAAEMEAISSGESIGEAADAVAEIIQEEERVPDVAPEELDASVLEEEEEPSLAEVFADQRLAEEQKRAKAHKWDTMSLEFLSPEEKEIFSYFIPVSGMEKQICAVLQGVKSRKLDSTSSQGNIVIEGAVRSGKTVLATDLIKVLQTNDPDNVAKVGRISGDKLNDRDVDTIINTIKGGYLIIERAGKMTADTAFRLNSTLAKDTDNLLVIMEDTRKGLMELGEKCPSLVEKFTEQIQIPVFTIDEMVNFANYYAKEKGYCTDQMSILALYKCIANIRNVNETTTLTEIMDIVNQAVENSEKHKLSRKTNEEHLYILKEKDFPIE